MRFKYVGRHRAVEVPAVGAVVARGDTIEVTGDDAQSLLRQDNEWQRVDKPDSKDGE